MGGNLRGPVLLIHTSKETETWTCRQSSVIPVLLYCRVRRLCQLLRLDGFDYTAAMTALRDAKELRWKLDADDDRWTIQTTKEGSRTALIPTESLGQDVQSVSKIRRAKLAWDFL